MPTFRKWIQYLSKKISYSDWKKRRKLSWLEIQVIFEEFGDPNSGECLTKGQIVECCESTYRVIADMVVRKAEELGFGLVAYRAVDIYPPADRQSDGGYTLI
ncbi:hypothetical protein [Lewinella sp. IMCC34183]|uniref:hypothetical protein n=1 Tax=Lewinella sp. IMCC34183 TaxID=2248762 RepID=UPI001300B3E8|nr:hypothetical protein [Lewinella sp. IMCC34183]